MSSGALTVREALVRDRVRKYYDMARAGGEVNCHEAAGLLGFSCYTTLQNRLRRPNAFTLGELETIAGVMNITLEELIGEEA